MFDYNTLDELNRNATTLAGLCPSKPTIFVKEFKLVQTTYQIALMPLCKKQTQFINIANLLSKLVQKAAGVKQQIKYYIRGISTFVFKFIVNGYGTKKLLNNQTTAKDHRPSSQRQIQSLIFSLK